MEIKPAMGRHVGDEEYVKKGGKGHATFVIWRGTRYPGSLKNIIQTFTYLTKIYIPYSSLKISKLMFEKRKLKCSTSFLSFSNLNNSIYLNKFL